MRILVIGTGGVGSAFAAIAQRRSFYERIVLADLDAARPQAVVDRLGEHDRFGSAGIDASSEDAIVDLIADVRADAVLNATDPRFNPQIFDACLRARVTYLDMAMTLSEPHPVHPHAETHVKLGDYQFAQDENWRQEGLLALVGIGVEPGASDVFARHTADELFSEIDEIGIRDGSNLVIEGYDFAPTFSI
ncbi:MAG: saccharopine dehydrogenase NADP-binding domain-containing protein, partial [Gaiellaceae bacterium]